MSILSRLRRLLIVKRKPSIQSSAISDLHKEVKFLRHHNTQLFERARIGEGRLARIAALETPKGSHTSKKMARIARGEA